VKVIVQEETTGCGIASVANVIEQPYAAVKKQANAIGIFADDEKLYSDVNYVRNLLGQFGLQATPYESAFVSWQDLPDRALLAIKYHELEGRAFWHWVVFRRMQAKAVVLDSAVAFSGVARTDFENIEPKWFIEVMNA